MQKSALRKVLVVCAAFVVAGGFANDAFARDGGGGHGGGGHDGGGHMGGYGGHGHDGFGHHDGHFDHHNHLHIFHHHHIIEGNPALFFPFGAFLPEDRANDCWQYEHVRVGGHWVWERFWVCG